MSRVTNAGEERLGSAQWCCQQPDTAESDKLWFKTDTGQSYAFRFSDMLRSDSAHVVAALADAGYAIEMLSGDNSAQVSDTARDAGIASWRAEQRPDQKISRLEDLKAAGHRVLMVGDGLNDAPALAAAHASISPSSAVDISQTAADAIFQGDRLQPVIELLAVAKATRALSMQNFALAVAYNLVFVPLAMAGLVTPLIAAVAMSASSISVTANAIRLRSQTLELKS
jgi:Cu2+-exporting ATPase